MTIEVNDFGSTGITPGRSIANADFCPCVDEHQLNIRETAIMARNSGIPASKVAGIMTKRQNAASEAERSRAAEFKCTHDNLLAAVDQLRTEKDAALEQLKVMKRREGQLTERSKKQDKERERAEKATESSWRDEKEELEFDLENIRSALATSNGKAADAEKRVRRLESELAKTREEVLQATKSKGGEAASNITPKNSPKREKKGRGAGSGPAAAPPPLAPLAPAPSPALAPAPAGGSGGGSGGGSSGDGGAAAGNEPSRTFATPTEKKKNKPKTKQDRTSPDKKVDKENKEKNNRVDSRYTDNSMLRGRRFAQKLCIAVKKRCNDSARDSLTSKSTALGMLAIGAVVSVILAVGFSVVPSGLRSAAGGSLEIDNYTRVATEHNANACASQPCRHKGVCTASDVNDSYLCACEKGFHGDSCENKFWDRVMNDGKEDDDADWWDAAAASVDDIDETMCVSCAPYALRSCTQHCVLWW